MPGAIPGRDEIVFLWEIHLRLFADENGTSGCLLLAKGIISFETPVPQHETMLAQQIDESASATAADIGAVLRSCERMAFFELGEAVGLQEWIPQ